MGWIKNLNLIIAISFFTSVIKAQEPIIVCWYSCNGGLTNYVPLDFDDSTVTDFIYFDSSLVNNIWQIGKPQKQFFNSALTFENTLVTDTINTYPAYNTSVFFIKTIVVSPHPSYGTTISFTHKFDSDSLIDGGTIEVSYDNGNTWINIIEDLSNQMSTYGLYSINDTISSLQKPGYSGNFGWDYVTSSIASGDAEPDTLIFKFTFSSDSIDNGKDGWMIGDFSIGAYGESIEEYSDNNSISIFPNPTSGLLRYKTDKNFHKPFQVSIIDIIGNSILENIEVNDNEVLLPFLENGIYFVNFVNENFYSRKKIIIQN